MPEEITELLAKVGDALTVNLGRCITLLDQFQSEIESLKKRVEVLEQRPPNRPPEPMRFT